jgi:hypothetical protein
VWGWWKRCFSNKGKSRVVDSGVSVMKKVKSVEQWCFSIGKNDEKLLTMVFQQQKRKGETIVGRCCFVDGEW